jgi:APA family basic amino acid/polyamine antiporter
VSGLHLPRVIAFGYSAGMSEESPLPHASLPRVLGFVTAAAIVVGEVIGSGIFFKPAEVARAANGQVGIILTLWVVCGLVSLCGALTLAELSAMFPHAGGTYVFLREAYGRTWAFLWCWAEFWVIRTGAIAALAVYSCISLESLTRDAGLVLSKEGWSVFRRGAAISMIGGLGVINILATHWGGHVQTAMTVIKIAFVALLAVLPFIALGEGSDVRNVWWPDQMQATAWLGIGSALGAIMWTYDGWGNVTVIAEEIHHPERNLPRALIGGVLLLIALYFGANLAYHLTLPAEEIGREMIPSYAVCEKLMPGYGGKVMVAMLLISLFGALSGNILVGPRVLYAVARDYTWLKPFRHVNARTRTPARAIAAVCAWAMVLVLLPDVHTGDRPTNLADWLTSYCIFGGSIFYLSAVLAVFVLRKRRPDAVRPYRAWGYPITPAIFVLFYIFLLGTLFYARPRECLWGLSLIAAGLVVYLVMSRFTNPNKAG